jgi:peptidoglycan/LPS O-acetylase OafA/YrhL
MPVAKTVASPSHRDPALDGLRGLAILFVFLYHYGGGLKSHNPLIHICGILCSAGWIGVPIFFTLSGFLITTILWETQQHRPRAPHRLRNFYARRILRIFPLYYFALALAAIAMLAVGGSFHDLRYFTPEAFFLLDIPGISHASAIVSPLPLFHFWTLAVEEQFYILWPLLLLCCRTRRAAIQLCLATFFLSFGFCIAVYAFPQFVSAATAKSFNQFLLTNVGALALGGLVALLSQSRRNRHCEPFAPVAFSSQPASNSTLYRFSPFAFVLGIAIFLIACLHGHTFNLNNRDQFFTALPAIWLSSATLIPMVLRTGHLRAIFSTSAFRFLGRISYGFYVFHILLKPLYDNIARHLIPAPGYPYFITHFFTAFLVTLAISWLSFHLLESPFLKLKHHFPLQTP